MRKLPLYCRFTKDRHGKIRVRFEKRNAFSAYIYSKIGTKEFTADYANCLAGASPAIGVATVANGTIAKLFALWYQHPNFLQLKDSTRNVFRGDLERFKLKYGDLKVSDFKKVHLNKIIGGMADRPQAANNLIKRLRPVLDLAIDLEWLTINPARGVKGYSKKTKGFIAWTNAEMDTYEDFHASGTPARLAYAIAYYTASRRSDVIILGKQHLSKDGGTYRLKFRQTKTDALVDMPVHPALLKEINLLDHNELTFLLTSHGRAYTVAGFGKWFRQQCNLAGLHKLSVHGLRKSATKTMIDTGHTTAEAGGITGHQTLAEIDHYARDRDNSRLADRAVSGLTRNRK